MEFLLPALAAFVIIGLLSGLIGTSALKAELKSVYKKTQANSYVVSGSLNLVKRRETYLYSKEERRERPKAKTN